MKKIGQNFVDAVRSMTAKEIIMHMVESLRNPVTEIKMSTYGQTNGIKCFGCAATNFIAHKLNYSKEDLMDIFRNRSGKDGEGFNNSAENQDLSSFIGLFESTINELRRGDIIGYNNRASILDISMIKSNNVELPHLGDQFTKEHLDEYIELANYQV